MALAYTITRNDVYNSLEVAFSEKPSEAVRTALKGLKFRWHNIKKVWYGYADEEVARAAIEGRTVEKVKSDPVNKYGVKVGDLFSAVWGYDQTNVDYFQVVALVGSSSVRVRQVTPPIIEDRADGWASATRTYKVKDVGILPAAPYSVFIRDQENGDLKRLKSYMADGVSNPQFRLDSFADAHYCGGDTETHSESWYH